LLGGKGRRKKWSFLIHVQLARSLDPASGSGSKKPPFSSGGGERR
jgi:hypothetical protein